MKKLNKLFAILVAMAMVLSLTVIAAFAGDDDTTVTTNPPANEIDFAVTKLLKVPTGTDIPNNTTVTVVFDNTEINSVATDAGYDKDIPLTLNATNAKVTDDTTKPGTTYYYYTTDNMLEALGLKADTVKAGVYKYEIYEKDYKVNDTAYNALADNQHASIEKGDENSKYTLTVAKKTDGSFSITAKDKDGKVIVKNYDGSDNTSVTGNGLMLINAYYETGSGENYNTSTFKVTKDVTGDNDLYDGSAFEMSATITLPDIDGVAAEAYIKRAAGGTDEKQTFTSGTAFTIALAEGDELYVTKAPAGTLVTVSETDSRAGTSTEAKMYTKSGEFANETVTATAQTKTITNAYNDSTTEGVLHNSIPYIVLALVAIGGMVAYVVVRRRNADEA